ncbi:MAG: PDZ domain-containing protein [Erythrobacter sp.]
MNIFKGRGLARTFLLTASTAALAVGGLPGNLGFLTVPQAAAQGAKQASNLPKPYVSRAVDAALMELTPAVRSQFGIKPNVKGVLVISTQPGGIAAQNGIRPGDVITDIRGRRVDTPLDVDTHVLYWLKKGDTAFQFVGNRGGSSFNAAAQITLALFDAVIDLATMGSWSAYSYGGWSYTEYYEEYSSVIVEEYTSSETIIEQTIESSSFETEMTSEETSVTEESSSEETSVSEESSSEESAESSEESEDEGADDADDGDDGDDDSGDEADDADDDGGDEAEDDGGDDDSGDEVAVAFGPASPYLSALA